MKNYNRLAFLAIAVVLLAFVYLVSPDIKFPLIIHKLSLVSIAAVVGYFLDVILFPSFRPHDMTDKTPPQIVAATLIRRALIMMAVILGVTMGV